MLQRGVGPQVAAAAVLFGEVLDGPAAERVGLVYRCVEDDELLATAHAMAAKAADVPRQLAITTKQTLRDMTTVTTHADAVEREIEPQVWSTQQPWFRERLAAMQAKISSKRPG
jgi:enoyl-CoA hydratase